MKPPFRSSTLKSALKRVLAPILYHLGYYHATLRALRERALVVMYHRVTDQTLPARRRDDPVDRGINVLHFEAQIRYLRERMTPLPLDELVDRMRRSKPLPARAIAVTFDDGYEDTYTVASPVLKRYSVPATVFVVAGFLDCADIFWWEKVPELLRITRHSSLDMLHLRALSPAGDRLPRRFPLSSPRKRARAAAELIGFMKDLPSAVLSETLCALQDQLDVTTDAIDGSRHRIMNPVQLQALATDGIAVGAHTLTHPNLRTISHQEDLIHEIRSSKRILEDITQRPVTGFAYPYGFPKHYTQAARQAVIEAGFLFACTARPGVLTRKDDSYEIPRVSAPSTPLPMFLWQLAKHV